MDEGGGGGASQPQHSDQAPEIGARVPTRTRNRLAACMFAGVDADGSEPWASVAGSSSKGDGGTRSCGRGTVIRASAPEVKVWIRSVIRSQRCRSGRV